MFERFMDKKTQIVRAEMEVEKARNKVDEFRKNWVENSLRTTMVGAQDKVAKLEHNLGEAIRNLKKLQES
jgi:hypothetical protein